MDGESRNGLDRFQQLRSGVIVVPLNPSCKRSCGLVAIRDAAEKTSRQDVLGDKSTGVSVSFELWATLNGGEKFVLENLNGRGVFILQLGLDGLGRRAESVALHTCISPDYGGMDRGYTPFEPERRL